MSCGRHMYDFREHLNRSHVLFYVIIDRMKISLRLQYSEYPPETMFARFLNNVAATFGDDRDRWDVRTSSFFLCFCLSLLLFVSFFVSFFASFFLSYGRSFFPSFLLFLCFILSFLLFFFVSFLFFFSFISFLLSFSFCLLLFILSPLCLTRAFACSSATSAVLLRCLRLSTFW